MKDVPINDGGVNVAVWQGRVIMVKIRRLDGGLHLMTGSNQEVKIAGAFRGRLWLKEVHPYSC